MNDTTPIDRFRWMARIRAFERSCLEGVSTQEIHGELHTSIGQEAVAAGMAGLLRREDALVSTHRNHGHALVKGVDPHALMAEIFERSTGLCGGFGGHMHPFDPRRRFSATGIVGASLPVALGQAYASVLAQRDTVAVGVVGDGAVNHGTFHECLTMASAWRLPLVVLIENNGLAISVKPQQVAPPTSAAQRAAAYGCQGDTVDGTDVEAVAEVFGGLVETVRSERTPGVLEAFCTRLQGHYEGDAQMYRGDLEGLAKQDPLMIARAKLVDHGVRPDALDDIEHSAADEMTALLELVRREAFPEPSEALDHVFADLVTSRA